MRVPPRRLGTLDLMRSIAARPTQCGRNGPELILAHRGTVVLAVDGRIHRLRAADALWLFPDCSARIGPTSSEASWWSLRIDPQLLAGVGMPTGSELLSRWPPVGAGVAHLPPAYAGWFEARLSELQQLEDPILFNAALVHAAVGLWDACRPDLRHAHHGPLVAEALRRLDAEPARWSLGALAEALGVSPGHLARSVRRETGQTVLQHRQLRQVSAFVTAWNSGRSGTVTDAAFAAGFGSYAQFHRVFRAHTGMSPAEYRRRAS